MKHKGLFPILIAALAVVPGVAIRLAGIELSPPQITLISGMAILGASFLLLWACDAFQVDVSQTLALAVVALIAVLPEYAVDMYFTWMAGKHPESDYAHYAIANMTGANRLLIGVAWGVIAAVYWFRFGREVRLEKERRTELLFLGMATAYAFVIPIKGLICKRLEYGTSSRGNFLYGERLSGFAVCTDSVIMVRRLTFMAKENVA
jgi:cation:H+ antiporter